MAATATSQRRSSRNAVTDQQRANALLRLGRGEEIVNSAEVERILRTMGPNHVVRVRQTPAGPIYRVTPAGQRWAVAQLASSFGHSANIVRKPGVPRAEPLLIEERGSEWRVVDQARHVRTPWLSGSVRSSVVEKAAKFAVRRTDPAKPTGRHTRDGDWIVVHSL
jgi:hypothetical protein